MSILFHLLSVLCAYTSGIATMGGLMAGIHNRPMTHHFLNATIFALSAVTLALHP